MTFTISCAATCSIGTDLDHERVLLLGARLSAEVFGMIALVFASATGMIW